MVFGVVFWSLSQKFLILAIDFCSKFHNYSIESIEWLGNFRLFKSEDFKLENFAIKFVETWTEYTVQVYSIPKTFSLKD